MFLTLPVSWRGTIAQYAGRLHRLYDGKREVRVYDYADLNVPMLARMFDRRCRGYEAVGYTILLPASAIPGWPADVVLPSDPVWKRDYSGSVRRLVRDGVDTPLASLFVHVGSAGASRCRRRRPRAKCDRGISLSTAGDAAGDQGTFPRERRRCRSRSTASGRLEVDLLCADARVAVELDGAQHLADPVAYRRDGARTSCCRRTAIWCCAFSPKTSARNWTRCSTRSCERLSQRGTIAPAMRLNFVRGGRS